MIVLLTLFSLMFMGICSLAFLAWIIREHRDAKKYRHLVALEERMPKATKSGGPQWSITYKEGRKQHTVIVPGATEAEAMREFVKTYSVGFGNIITSVKL